ncbi:MAG: hypothetical protein PHV06_00130 [bacterium]|nr:hypothetical protein [bacterium]
MVQSLKNFKEFFKENVLEILWDQWVSIGVPGFQKNPVKYYIDPEALIMLSLAFARYDSRLFDEIINWLFKHGALINIQRINRIINKHDYAGLPILSSISDYLSRDYRFRKWKGLTRFKKDGGLENLFINLPEIFGGEDSKLDEVFKAHGYSRGILNINSQARDIPVLDSACLIFNLRYLFGINSRSEIMLYLLTHDQVHPTELSRSIYYSQKNIQDTLVEMSKSNQINVSVTKREKFYALDRTGWKNLFKLNPEITWIDFPNLFFILEKVWIELMTMTDENMNPLLIASRLKQTVKELKDVINRLGFGIYFLNHEQVFGEEYSDYFIDQFTDFLKRIKE